MKNEIIVKVPATSANMGSGFDCIGIALDIWNTVKVKELSSSYTVTIIISRMGISMFSQISIMPTIYYVLSIFVTDVTFK